MTDWRQTTTAELLDRGVIEIGDGYRAKNAEFVENGGLPFVRVGDVRATIRLEGLDELPLDQVARYGPKVSRPFDSLITMKGTIGRVAFVSTADRTFVYSPQLSYWRCHDASQVHPRWLRYWLESPEFLDQASATKGATDMADYINLRDQRRMRITLPAPPVQRQIADMLSGLDNLIENNRRRIELLEQMAQEIYREWFIRFRYPGHERANLIDSPLGPIPEGWDVLTASQLLEINPRLRVDNTVQHPFFTMADLNERSMVCFPSGRKSGVSGSKFKNGDTLFARITPCLENGKTGLVRCLSPEDVGRGSTEFIVLRGRLVGPAYTYLLARDPDFRGNAIKSMSGASGRQRVRAECFDSFFLASPPRLLAKEFELAAEPLLTMAYALANRNRTLARIRDLLLPKLVTGQIDVSRLNLDPVLGSVT
jgi:type I restriction enzyme S subunit